MITNFLIVSDGSKIDFQSEQQKQYIVILLLLSSVLAALLLWNSEPVDPVKLTSPVQLDSMIVRTLNEFNIPETQIRTESVQIDSIFSRNIYTVFVSPLFSKTTLHFELKQHVWPYDVRTIASVEFPERHMNLHLLYENTIYRSLQIRTDPDIQVIHQELFTPPDKISDELD